jgi:hypothetical protein
MNRLTPFLLALLCASIVPAHGRRFYVAPTGNNANAGTLAAPFLTIQRAQTSVAAGDTVYIRGGTYQMQTSQIATTTTGSPQFAYVTHLTQSGTAGRRINYWAYPGEQPVFDYTNVTPANTRINAFEVTGSWLHLRGLEVVGVQVTTAQNINTQSICFSNSAGSNNIYEQLKMHDGMAIGFYLNRGANNLVLNCDAYNNWDSVSGDQLGGNVDGFGAHPNQASYTGNVFRGCRAWFNSDDGYDCISSDAAITFDNCWSFYNGYSTSFQSLANGLGFKAGGYGVSANPNPPAAIPRNVVRRCLAVQNKSAGFYANHHLGGLDFLNNTAYMNATNYNLLNRAADYLSDVPGYGHVLRNNVSLDPRSANSHITNYDAAQCTIDHNTFLNPGITVSTADFRSLNKALLTQPRQPNGDLPNIDLLQLVAGSDLIDAGVNVGLPYVGNSPDLGYREYSAAPLKVHGALTVPQAPALLYPNPAREELTVSLAAGSHAATLNLYAVTGTVLRSERLASGTTAVLRACPQASTTRKWLRARTSPRKK